MYIAATLKSTRLQIADEEARELAAGTLPPHDVSPGVFLQHGLKIEEQQCVFPMLTCHACLRAYRSLQARHPRA